MSAPVDVRWVGEPDPDTRRAVEAAVAAGVRRALDSVRVPAAAGSVTGRLGTDPRGAGAGGLWWMPSYDGGGAPVGIPVRAAAGNESLPLGDVLVREAYPAVPVVRVAVDDWIRTGDGAHVTSPSLHRAVQWGRTLYGAQGFAVLELRQKAYVMTPLAEPVLSSRFEPGPAAPPGEDGPAVPGLRVNRRGRIVELTGQGVVLVGTADGQFGLALGRSARWTPAAVRREMARTPPAQHLDPAVAARIATVQLTAAGSGAEPGTPDEDVMLARIVQMDRDVFGAMPWEQRAGFLTALSGLMWPSARQKKAMVELLAAARSTSELEAMAAILRQKDAYRRLFTTLDGSVVELLLILGRARPARPMDARYVAALFRHLGLTGGDDPAGRIRSTANGLSLWVRSTVEGIADLFTHSPAELIEGLTHLAEFALMVRRATAIPPDPKALATLQLLAEQAGRAIRTAMAGLEYAEELGLSYGDRAAGVSAHVTGDLASTLATALAVEILSWFVGIGEIKEALGAAELTERLAALLSVLMSVRRLRSAAEVAREVSKLDRFVAALTRLASLRDEVAAANALRLLPAGQLSEVTRLAELLDVPAGARIKTFRELARAHGVLPDVERAAAALSLARRVERRAAQAGGLTEDMIAALHRLLDTGWDRRTLGALVDAVPPARLGEWSRAVSRLHPGHVEQLGARYLEALAYWPRSLTFVAESGGDVYLTMLRRHGGDTRAVDDLLHALELRRTEIGDPAGYQRLLDRLAGGHAAAYAELDRRIAQAAENALQRLRSGGRRHLLAELEQLAPGSARRDQLAMRIGELSDRETAGLDHVARLAESGVFEWESVLDLARADRADLLVLIDDLAGRVPANRLAGVEEVLKQILERNVGKAGQMENAVQGGWGELYAARTLIADLGATSVDFQVRQQRRIVDLAAELPGRGLVDVEVKTNLSGAASFNETQIIRDLTEHAGGDYRYLMYLYHPNVAGELPGVGQRMLALFDGTTLPAALVAAGHDPAVARAAFQNWLAAGNLRVYRL